MEYLNDTMNYIVNTTKSIGNVIYTKTNDLYNNYYNNEDKKHITSSEIENTIKQLLTIKKNVNERNESIQENIKKFTREAKESFLQGHKHAAIYKMKLKKMYEQEQLKWETICFNIDTQIFSIDSMGIIMDTVDILKNTTKFNIDITQFENVVEHIHEHKDLGEELQSIFNTGNVSEQFDEKDILSELENMTNTKKKEITINEHNNIIKEIDLNKFPSVPTNTLKIKQTKNKI